MTHFERLVLAAFSLILQRLVYMSAVSGGRSEPTAAEHRWLSEANRAGGPW